MVAGLVLGRAEIAALAVPLIAAAGLALTYQRIPDLECSTELERERLLEGDETVLRLHLLSKAGIPQLELFLPLSAPLELKTGRNSTVLRLMPHEPRTLELRLSSRRWGSYRLGPMYWRAHDRFGCFRWEGRFHAEALLRIYPKRKRLQSLLPPLQTQVFVGNQVSRAKGAGIEFADTRDFRPGDRVRSINWRASARRGQLIVNEHHPERNTDVVLLIDTFAEVRREAAGTMDDAVRAAASVAAGYLARRDRVGLVTFGGQISWLRPGFGPMQLYRITEALIEAQVVFTHVVHDVDVLPPRTLPPQALVLAFSPLADPRAVNAILNVRGRGFDIVVVEVSPTRFLPQPTGTRDQLARRLWMLSRNALRETYRRAGISVIEWNEQDSLPQRFEEVARSRRRAQPIRA
jgi:uncharacterized protein (DUF58 family)